MNIFIIKIILFIIMNILNCFTEKENVAFESMTASDCIKYTDNRFDFEEVSELNEVTREEKVTEETIDVPTCKTARH